MIEKKGSLGLKYYPFINVYLMKQKVGLQNGILDMCDTFNEKGTQIWKLYCCSERGVFLLCVGCLFALC